MASRRWSTSDEQLAQSLAWGSTVKQAAAAAGISERTAYRRLEDSDFAAKLAAIKVEYLDRSTSMLSASAIESVKTLVNLQNQTVPERVRLGAAKAALTIGIKMREEQELSKRLSALEDMFKALQAGSERTNAGTQPSSNAEPAGESSSEVDGQPERHAGENSDRPSSTPEAGGDEG